MRALLVLLALVATPYVAGVAQGRTLKGKSSVRPADVTQPGLGHDDAHCAMRADLHPDMDINSATLRRLLLLLPRPQVGRSAGQCSMTPTVMACVILPRSVSGVGSSCSPARPFRRCRRTPTGTIVFTGLSAGNYTVCAQQRNFYFQTTPPGTACGPTQGGFTIVLSAGQVVPGQDFGFFF